MNRCLLRYLRRFRRSDDGNSTIEFVMLFPPLFLIFLSGFDAGMMMMRNVWLERSLDIAVRELRLGDPSPPSYEEFRETICRGSPDPTFNPSVTLLGDCLDSLQIELTVVDPEASSPLDSTVRCIDKEEDINPADLSEFYGDTGGNNDFMLVRACMNVNPRFDFVIQLAGFEFKSLGAVLDSDGRNGYFMVATSAFVNEPSRIAE